MLQRNGTFAIFDAPLPVGTATIRKRCLTYVVTALWSVEAPVKVCSRVFRELLPTPSSVLALASPYVILRTGSTTQQRVDPIVIIMYNLILAPVLVPRRSLIGNDLYRCEPQQSVRPGGIQFRGIAEAVAGLLP